MSSDSGATAIRPRATAWRSADPKDPHAPQTDPVTVRGLVSEFDHSSNPAFTDYYINASLSEATTLRFSTIRDKSIRLLREQTGRTGPLEVMDIGCGAGSQSFTWAELGHRVTGLDVNGPLVQVARQRGEQRGLATQFDVGSATALPYAAQSFDVVLLAELLEHVADWPSVLSEALRVLKPNGLLFLSTTNALCPKQHEFNLPLYSWYPAFVKRRYERLAVTSRPEIANHAKYPAVHWFTFYELQRFVGQRGGRSFDRFDMIDLDKLGTAARLLVRAIRALPPLRFMGHVASSGTGLFAIMQASPTR
jgi:2-polyprenyl-3-methyl-5-hydroxy-6-metoxy-1,4-benzoquinol methylase